MIEGKAGPQFEQESRYVGGQTDRTFKVEKLIDLGLVEITKEIDAHKNGLGKVANIPFLEKTYNELLQLKSKMSAVLFKPSFARTVLDSWDYSLPLADLLIKIDYEYNKLK
ncbi:hypothetical protein [Bacillus paramycoides]|uniref:hypothetical protein n=1 Tax=Bacillus paramycoides TaxID=2026194 RepID=UPI002E23DE0C|nr:hypothetical protein [Bacillus paramycoides]MED1559605.1 hypothetical protein [Bacillus paramycoides]